MGRIFMNEQNWNQPGTAPGQPYGSWTPDWRQPEEESTTILSENIASETESITSAPLYGGAAADGGRTYGSNGLYRPKQQNEDEQATTVLTEDMAGRDTPPDPRYFRSGASSAAGAYPTGSPVGRTYPDSSYPTGGRYPSGLGYRSGDMYRGAGSAAYPVADRGYHLTAAEPVSGGDTSSDIFKWVAIIEAVVIVILIVLLVLK